MARSVAVALGDPAPGLLYSNENLSLIANDTDPVAVKQPVAPAGTVTTIDVAVKAPLQDADLLRVNVTAAAAVELGTLTTRTTIVMALGTEMFERSSTALIPVGARKTVEEAGSATSPGK